jgi:predicted MFS family arabinose efflux permease
VSVTTAARPSVDQRRATVILVAMAVSTFLFVLVEGLPGGLLTLMAPDLGRSTSEIGLLVTAYALVVLVASVPLAHATRHVPRRWLLSATVGLAAVATVAAGLAGSYEVVLAARVVTALAQALFWVAVVPATTGLFPAPVRGRVMARLAVGNALAPVVGIPVCTWLAEHTSWRAAFWAAAALSAVVFVVVIALFPTVPPAEGGATHAPSPSTRRFAVLLATTALVVTGSFGLITFATQFLQDVAGFARDDMPWLLAVEGVAGVAGAVVVGWFLDRHARASVVTAMAGLAAALALLWSVGDQRAAAVAALALFGLAFSAVPTTLGHRVMLIAPGSTDMGMAVYSSTFNLGIAGGSALGAGLTAAIGVRAVPLVSVVLVLLALLCILLEDRIDRGR